MKIQDILKGLPGNMLFQKYKSQFMCEAISVEEILQISDNREYEKWDAPNGGYHISVVGHGEITYGWLGDNEPWYMPKEPFYGRGRYLE